MASPPRPPSRSDLNRKAFQIAILAFISLVGTCDAFAGIPVLRPMISVNRCVSRGVTALMAERRFYDRAGGAGVVGEDTAACPSGSPCR